MTEMLRYFKKKKNNILKFIKDYPVFFFQKNWICTESTEIFLSSIQLYYLHRFNTEK